MTRQATHPLVFCAALGLTASVVSPVWAGAWTTSGNAQLSSSYDDNVLLTVTNPTGGWFNAADVSGRLAFEKDQLIFHVDPRLLATRYKSETDLNRTERYLTVFGQYATLQSVSSLNVTAAQDTTLTSELGLTGLSAANKRHRSESATLNTRYFFNETVDANLQLYATANRYLDAEATGLSDYNYGSAVLNANYQHSDQSAFFLQSTVGHLQVPIQQKSFGFIGGSEYSKTNLSAVLGYNWLLNPLWEVTVSAGPSQVRTKTAVASGQEYSLKLTRKSELMTLDTAFNRDVTPSGYGLLSRRDRVQFVLSQPVSERWLTRWLLTSVRTRNIGNDGALDFGILDYRDFTGYIGWRYSPTWTVSLSAGYARQQTQGSDSAAGRRHAALNISWNGLPHRLY